jgi:hypothetical protein
VFPYRCNTLILLRLTPEIIVQSRGLIDQLLLIRGETGYRYYIFDVWL